MARTQTKAGEEFRKFSEEMGSLTSRMRFILWAETDPEIVSVIEQVNSASQACLRIAISRNREQAERIESDRQPLFRTTSPSPTPRASEPTEPSPTIEAQAEEVEPRRCRECGCTDDDCRQCIEKTGEACRWVEADLCSACREVITERSRALREDLTFPPAPTIKLPTRREPFAEQKNWPQWDAWQFTPDGELLAFRFHAPNEVAAGDLALAVLGRKYRMEVVPAEFDVSFDGPYSGHGPERLIYGVVEVDVETTTPPPAKSGEVKSPTAELPSRPIHQLIELGIGAYRSKERGYEGSEAAGVFYDSITTAEKKSIRLELKRIGFDEHIGFTNDDARDRYLSFVGQCVYGIEIAKSINPEPTTAVRKPFDEHARQWDIIGENSATKREVWVGRISTNEADEVYKAATILFGGNDQRAWSLRIAPADAMFQDDVIRAGGYSGHGPGRWIWAAVAADLSALTTEPTPEVEPSKPARRSPQKTFQAAYFPAPDSPIRIDLGEFMAKNRAEAEASIADVFRGREVEVNGQVEPIDPTKVRIVPAPSRSQRKKTGAEAIASDGLPQDGSAIEHDLEAVLTAESEADEAEDLRYRQRVEGATDVGNLENWLSDEEVDAALKSKDIDVTEAFGKVKEALDERKAQSKRSEEIRTELKLESRQTEPGDYDRTGYLDPGQYKREEIGLDYRDDLKGSIINNDWSKKTPKKFKPVKIRGKEYAITGGMFHYRELIRMEVTPAVPANEWSGPVTNGEPINSVIGYQGKKVEQGHIAYYMAHKKDEIEILMFDEDLAKAEFEASSTPLPVIAEPYRNAASHLTFLARGPSAEKLYTVEAVDEAAAEAVIAEVDAKRPEASREAFAVSALEALTEQQIRELPFTVKPLRAKAARRPSLAEAARSTTPDLLSGGANHGS